MAEGARLESVYTVSPYRGFESLSLRQILYVRALPPANPKRSLRVRTSSRTLRQTLFVCALPPANPKRGLPDGQANMAWVIQANIHS